MQRTPDDSSIFTAEAKAIDLALDFISTCDANNKFLIFSDSLSVLKAMNHTSSKNPQIQKLLERCHELLANKEIVLCWIPSHIGIQGNEMVDKQAKTSLSLEPTSFKIPFSNFKPSINKYILEEWLASWNISIGNKLLDIKTTIGEHQSVVPNIRKEEVILARLRLGNTRVTHSYLLQSEEQPQCVGCDAPFTVRHFLLECGDFAQVRNNCFHVDNFNFKPSINKYILEEWQASWNISIGNKLLDIKTTIGEHQSVVPNIRKEEVVLARLCLGHTRVTHSNLLLGE